MNNLMTLTTPLMRRTVGFDRFNDLFESIMSDAQDASFESYPPYNIEKTGEDTYRIVMAVAGFTKNDLDIVLDNGELKVSGKIVKDAEKEEPIYLHRGIANRAFERRFRLADHIRVEHADMENGLLHIELVHEVPEEKKPRTIAIGDKLKAIGKKK